MMRPSAVRSSLPMTRSAWSAPHNTKAAKGSCEPEKHSSSSVNRARSACRPGDSSPSSWRPRTFAEPRVVQPGTVRQPTDAFEIVDSAQTESLRAGVFLVDSLGRACVEADVQPFDELGAFLHHLPCRWARGARCQVDLDDCVVVALVVCVNEPFAVGQDHLGILHSGLRRKPAVVHAQGH